MSILSRTASSLDRRFGWARLPKPIAILTLVGLRTRLRHENLYDTETVHPLPPAGETPERARRARTWTGATTTFLASDGRGRRPLRPERAARTHLPGRAARHPRAEPVISRELLTRREFIPATTLNLLAGAWLQFEVHDWFSHGKNEVERPWEVSLGEGDDWAEDPMRIPRTRRDPTSDDDPTTPPTYVTADSHWWDGSQIYGSEQGFADALRSGESGKIRVDENGLLPADLEQHVDLKGVAGNFWLGLGLLHTLFTLEHNAICDAIKADNPSWDDERIYDTARP